MIISQWSERASLCLNMTMLKDVHIIIIKGKEEDMYNHQIPRFAYLSVSPTYH